jgi:hypothetical protein
MKHRKLYAWLFLAYAAILLLNAASPEGFFPSGHGTGRVSEVIFGAVFGFAGVMMLISRRGRTQDKPGTWTLKASATRCWKATSHADLVLRVEVSTLRRDEIWNFRLEISNWECSLTIE